MTAPAAASPCARHDAAYAAYRGEAPFFIPA